MWPWFGKAFDRALNRRLLTTQLTPLIRQLPQPVHAVTSIPITADLPGRLPVEHWTYYCVDDFAEWPGLDGDTLRQMDVEMIARADNLLAVSDTLRNAISEQGRSSTLLTHGVDLTHWQHAVNESSPSPIADDVRRPLIVFWGMVDRRLDSKMLRCLAERLSEGTIVLVGRLLGSIRDRRAMQLSLRHRGVMRRVRRIHLRHVGFRGGALGFVRSFIGARGLFVGAQQTVAASGWAGMRSGTYRAFGFDGVDGRR